MEDYWLVTLQWRERGDFLFQPETLVIDEHPVDFMADLKGGRETVLLNALRITEEQYTKYKDILE
jgi:hypothetical protein